MDCSLSSELCSCWNLATIRKHGRNIKPETKKEKYGQELSHTDEKMITCNSGRNLVWVTFKSKGRQSRNQKLILYIQTLCYRVPLLDWKSSKAESIFSPECSILTSSDEDFGHCIYMLNFPWVQYKALV